MTSGVFSLPSHPVAALFPLMSESELAALAADIKANGLRLPIVLDHQGQTVVDGRNRREACKRARVAPKTCMLRQDENPVHFILSLNVRRRHLDESQRGMVAARIANLVQGARTDLASIEAKSEGWISQVDAAGLLNIGRATVQRAKTVVEIGTPELIEAVDGGKIKLNEAERIARLPPEQQRQLVARPKAERKAARPESPLRAYSARAASDPPEPIQSLDPVAVLMAQVRQLGHRDLARFTEQFSAYCRVSATAPPTKSDAPEPIVALACRSPNGECRYTGCATAGQCLAQAAAA
jgi:ParB-like chromosome segregation protein Spo0J